MKPNDRDRTVETSGAQGAANFGISFKDEVHLMGILRDTLYSDKILAVLREYSANAWDAHRSIGRGDVPIEVTLPTRPAPTLVIRDRGPGLSHEDVFAVYTQYGASTKRGDDDTVGCLGIGSKSAFAYSDSFTVTSWHGGSKRVYVAVLDETNRGRIDLMSTESCGEETGVEVKIAARLSDVDEFESRARRLFVHFSPRPTINCELAPPAADAVALPSGEIRPVGADDGGEWVAVMGCVPYRVNLDQLPQGKVNPALRNLSGTISFPIGGVQISASREELKYGEATNAAIVARLDALVDEYVKRALDLLGSEAISDLDKRLRVLTLDELGLDVPEEYATWTKRFVKLIADPATATFTLTHNKSAVATVTVTPGVRILVDDVRNRSLSGYGLSVDDYVVRAIGRGVRPEALRAQLDAALAAANLRGVPVLLISTLPWESTRRGPSYDARTKNPKHKVRSFVLDPESSFRAPYSGCWTPVDRVPEATDVFVVIENFRAYDDFYHDFAADKRLCEALGIAVPTVYGYKTTAKRPTMAADCAGTEYRAWRRAFNAGLLTPERSMMIAARHRMRALTGSYGDQVIDKKRARAIVRTLGPAHPISALVAGYLADAKVVGSVPTSALDDVARRCAVEESESVRLAVAAVEETYHLMRHDRGLKSLWYMYGTNWREWLRYVQMVDIAKRDDDHEFQQQQ